MTTRSAVLLAIFSISLSLGAGAQTLRMGYVEQPSNQGMPSTSPASSHTYIDLTGPADASGTVTRASLTTTGICTGPGLTLLFVRRTGDELTVFDTRGPFDIDAEGTVNFAAVTVEAGDLLGVRVDDTLCAGPSARGYGQDDPFRLVGLPGSPDTVRISQAIKTTGAMSITATGDATEHVVGVIPVIASTAGQGTSSFKTSMRLHNPYTASEALTARLIYHPAGRAGRMSDPSRTMQIDRLSAVTIEDVAADFLAQTGVAIGSIDVVVPNVQRMPVIQTRIFDDQGEAGTKGFFEPMLIHGTDYTTFLLQGDHAALLGPPDATRARMNIGIRTFDAGAIVRFTVRTQFGRVLRFITKEFDNDYLEQTSFATFFGIPLEDGYTIEIEVLEGSLVAYGAINDNTTHDPAMELARAILDFE